MLSGQFGEVTRERVTVAAKRMVSGLLEADFLKSGIEAAENVGPSAATDFGDEPLFRSDSSAGISTSALSNYRRDQPPNLIPHPLK